ncbi:MAG TPA: LytTR family DNA-binding domain-containing protein [Gemmatimonadaceae bacterium]|nr:LytTR family DNA-binding domain-containing protein [Gemmatimonadaceae bacterium]
MNARGPCAVIAEDEEVLRDELAAGVAGAWPDLRIAAAVPDGFAALQALDEHEPEVLFLDIEMPGISGIEVARRASGRCHVVFVTAYDQFAVAAFEQGAVDYVMKPLNPERLAMAVDRLKARLAQAPADLASVIETLARRMDRPRAPLRWINASQNSELRLITVDEVCYFKSDAKYTRVVTAGQESVIRKPLRELAEELDPDTFWQIHRSIIVNLAEIAAIRSDFRGRLQVSLKSRPETLPVSQPYAHRFRQM